MTDEDIIRMARETGLWPAVTDSFPKELQEFANLVAAYEREACAKVCDDMSGPIEIYNPAYVHYIGCAEAIRARGQG
jgi:hypothetical protein